MRLFVEGRRALGDVDFPSPRHYYYVGLEEIVNDLHHNRRDSLERHEFYCRLFWPLSWFDAAILGNPSPGQISRAADSLPAASFTADLAPK